MNAIRTPGLRALWSLCGALAAALLASGIVRAEVGVAVHSVTAPRVIYVLDSLTEDPNPINPVWRPFPVTGGARIALNPEGELNGDGMPSLVTNAGSDLVAAAWSRHAASGFDVVVSRFAGGAWTTAQVVAGSSANELDPQLVLAPDGAVHMFFWVDGATPEVFHTVAPADLSSWSTPDRVSAPGETACRPAGAFYDGILRVAYEVHSFGTGNSPREVVLARFDNGAFTPEVVAMTNNLGSVSPQVHAQAGRLWVDWVDHQSADGSGEIAWTRLDAQGQWEAIRYQSFTDRIEREYVSRGGVRLQAIE